MAQTRQRRRSEQKAFNFLDRAIPLPPVRRRNARARIRDARRPLLEAKKIIRETTIPEIEGQTVRPDLWFEQVNDITWKLTDGVMTEQEGRLDKATTRALAWLTDIGWKGKHWVAYYKDSRYGPVALSEAKEAALAMVADFFDEPVSRQTRQVGWLNCRAAEIIDGIEPMAEHTVRIDTPA